MESRESRTCYCLLPTPYYLLYAMANRDNHYEVAFEEYLRSRGTPYVAVDEARRSLLADGESLKSLDFIVSASELTWLVDVKGRRFPSGDEQKQYWYCLAQNHSRNGWR